MRVGFGRLQVEALRIQVFAMGVFTPFMGIFERCRV